MTSNLKPLAASFLYITTIRQLRELVYQLACPAITLVIEDDRLVISNRDWCDNVPYMYKRLYYTGLAFWKERSRPEYRRYQSLLVPFSGRCEKPNMAFLSASTKEQHADWWAVPEAGFILTFDHTLAYEGVSCTKAGTQECYEKLSAVYQNGAVYDGRI